MIDLAGLFLGLVVIGALVVVVVVLVASDQ